jgi:hypothetical protein
VARIKRSSAVLDVARKRLAGLKSITPKPNFGPALDLDVYEQEIEAFSDKLDKYNEMLSLVDQLLNELETDEDGLNDKNKRTLAATDANYGSDSKEYEAAGGTRTSDIKRTPKKKKSGGS